MHRVFHVVALALLAACGGGSGDDPPPAAPAPTCTAWGTFQQIGTIVPDGSTGALEEISGLAASRLHPGVLWAHDDSGSAAILYALAEDGSLRQSYTLSTSAVDWEDIALGPGPDPAKEYLYVGDIGDNSRARPHVTLLRVEEPMVPAVPGAPIPLDHDEFVLRYPDAARDAEALLADWQSGALYVLGKSDAGGDVFRTPLPLDPSWTAAHPGVFETVTTGRPLPGNVTAADAGRDGQRVLFRTYLGGYELVRAPGGSFESLFSATPCTFPVPFLGQYESLALDPAGTALYTTTELFAGSSVPLYRSDAAGQATKP